MTAWETRVTATKSNFSSSFILTSDNYMMYSAFGFYKCCTTLNDEPVSCTFLRFVGSITENSNEFVKTTVTAKRRLVVSFAVGLTNERFFCLITVLFYKFVLTF
jgi:hypothetical protein